jgi:hypothetical protein
MATLVTSAAWGITYEQTRTRNLRILDPAYKPLRYSRDDIPIQEEENLPCWHHNFKGRGPWNGHKARFRPDQKGLNLTET